MSLDPIVSIWSDHFDALGSKNSVLRIAVIGIISNDSRRSFLGEHEAEKFLDESALVRRGRNLRKATLQHVHPRHCRRFWLFVFEVADGQFPWLATVVPASMMANP